jgi:hypothetical protein
MRNARQRRGIGKTSPNAADDHDGQARLCMSTTWAGCLAAQPRWPRDPSPLSRQR